MNKEIYYCAIGALILALVIVWAFVRANRRQDFRSATEARRRVGANRDNADGSQVRVGPGPQFARGGKGGTGPNGKGGAGGVARNTGPSRVVGKHPGFSAPYGRSTPSPTPAPDSYLDNPILNPIHPLHSAFTAPAETHHYSAPTPSPSYDCPSPTPSPSYDSGSSSSCDSPSSWD